MGVNSMQLQLRALRHPEAESTNSSGYHMLIHWLEDCKIRFYPPESRSGLATDDKDSWNSAFAQYLKELGCPLPEPHTDLAPRVKWLLRLSVAREYEDKRNVMIAMAGSGSSERPIRATCEASRPAKKQRLAMKVTAPELQSELEDVAGKVTAALGMPATPPTSLLHSLQAAQAAITQRMQPALDAHNSGMPRHTDSTSKFQLGFSTRDDKLDEVAKLLRIVYTRELSQMQSVVDDTMVRVQELTKNIRTDNSLRRTGR